MQNNIYATIRIMLSNYGMIIGIDNIIVMNSFNVDITFEPANKFHSR